MTTAIELITDSFRVANIIDENEVPTAEQGVSALRSLNDLLRDWEADGIRLGWQTVTELDDVLSLQEKDLRGVKYNFAVELSGDYGIEPSARVADIARTGFARLAKLAIQHVELNLDHLPTAEPYISGGGAIESGG